MNLRATDVIGLASNRDINYPMTDTNIKAGHVSAGDNSFYNS